MVYVGVSSPSPGGMFGMVGLANVDCFAAQDLEEVEEWNEFGELKENIGSVPSSSSTANHTVKTGVSTAPPIPINPTATQGTTKISMPSSVTNKAPQPGVDESKFRALPGAAEIAARNKPAPASAAATSPEQKEGKSVVDENAPPTAAESMTSAPQEKEESINAAKKILGEEGGGRRGVEHLSAPPSAMQSGTATPAEPAEKENVEENEGGLGVPGGDEGDEEKQTHRGSEVKEAPKEEVKKVESENSLVEAAEEADEGKDVAVAMEEGKGTTAAVEASGGGEGKVAEEVKEQSAKEGGDAGKSVGD